MKTPRNWQWRCAYCHMQCNSCNRSETELEIVFLTEYYLRIYKSQTINNLNWFKTYFPTHCFSSFLHQKKKIIRLHFLIFQLAIFQVSPITFLNFAIILWKSDMEQHKQNMGNFRARHTITRFCMSALVSWYEILHFHPQTIRRFKLIKNSDFSLLNKIFQVLDYVSCWWCARLISRLISIHLPLFFLCIVVVVAHKTAKLLFAVANFTR